MIAVFCEDAQEISALLEEVTVISQKTLGAATLIEAKLNDTEFLMVEAGYAKLNLGTAAGIAGALYPIDTIIGVGDAGVLKSRGADIGSVVVSETARQYDVDFSALGYEPSLVIGLPQPQYPCDDTLVALAKKESNALGIHCYDVNFGSADRFLADGDTFYGLSQEFGFDAADFATGSIGQYAFINQIPYVFVKGVSNYGDDAAPDDYYRWRSKADDLACRVVYRMLVSLTGGGGGGSCTGGDSMSADVDLARCKELTRAQILGLMPIFKTARLCVCENGQPYAVPMAFAYKASSDAVTLCMYSEPGGRKLAALAANAKVCVEFDEILDDKAVSVVALGTAEVTRGCFTAACNTGLYAIRVTVTGLSGRQYALCTK